MSTLVGSTEAARILGVSKATLYAYVSRGLVERRTAVDGRTSLYPRGDLEVMAARGRSRTTPARPSIDVRIGSAITELSDSGPSYRGHPVADLARKASFEGVAELLWTGEIPDHGPTWPMDVAMLKRVESATASLLLPEHRLSLAAMHIGAAAGTSAVPVARKLLALAPSVVGGPRRGSIAHRMVRAGGRSGEGLVHAVDRALVLLADHELATSTLAVRVACSVRTDPASAIVAGLSSVGGRLHGSSAREVVELYEAAAEVGADEAVRLSRERGGRVPGFGHTIYRDGDPRFRVLMEAVDDLDRRDRRDVVDRVVATTIRSIGRLPNIDAALGALLWVGGLRADLPVFAVARIAGWAAHHDEELAERPLRYRGLSQTS